MSSPMAEAVCHRHPRHVWIASCPECTTWHLAGQRAQRPGPAPAAD